jgi:hypothetical protein
LALGGARIARFLHDLVANVSRPPLFASSCQ